MKITFGFRMQANAWLQITPSGTPPSERGQGSAVWSNTADGLYIFGGSGASGFDDFWLFNRQAGCDKQNLHSFF